MCLVCTQISKSTVGLTLCPNTSSCFLMRGDDLVIYDANLGSEQTTLHTAVGMPLSKAIIFPAAQQICAVPNSKKPLPGVYSSKGCSPSVMRGTAKLEQVSLAVDLTLTGPSLYEYLPFYSCLTLFIELLWNSSMKLWNNFSSSDVCLQSVRENRCWNIWSLVNCY